MCTLSSCLQNEEPAGIEALRNAKAELIKAEAQYKVAEIALLQAQVAFQEAVNAGQELDNRMKELDLQIKEAEAAYWQAYYELQAAQDAAASEVELARLQAELLEQQLEQIRLENERELIAEQHKAALLEAQKAVAEAEKEYQEVLDLIASASTDLTQEEKDQLSYYTARVEEIRTKLNEAEDNLVSAQQAFVDAKYAYDEEGRRIELTGKVTAAQNELINIQTLLAEAQEIDLSGGANEWMTQKDEIETRIEELESQKNDIKLAASEKRQEKVAYQVEQADVQKTLDSLGLVYQSVEDEINELYSETAEESVSVPDNVYSNILNSFYYAIEYFNEAYQSNIDWSGNYDDGTVSWETFAALQREDYLPQQTMLIGTVLGVPKYVDYYYDDGQYGYDLRNRIQNYFSQEWGGVFRYSTVNDYIFSDTELGIVNERKAYLESQYNAEDGIKARYDDLVKMYNTSMADYLQAAETYGVVYSPDGYYSLAQDNAGARAVSAYDSMVEALNSGKSPTDAELTQWIGAISTEQRLRDQMYGYSWSRPDTDDPETVLTYTDFTVANYKAGTIDLNDLYTAVDMVIYNPVVESGSPAFYYNNDESDWGLAQQWSYSSQQVYANEYLRTPLTDEDRNDIQVNVSVYEDGTFYVYMTIEQSTDLYKKIAALYPGVNDSQSAYEALENSLWLSEFRIAKKIEGYDEVLAAQDEYKAVAEDLTALYDKYVAVFDEKLVQSTKLNEHLVQIVQEQAEAQDAFYALNDEISRIEKEANAMDGSQEWSEVSVIDIYIADLTRLSGTLEDLINGVEVTIPSFGEPGDENYYAGTTMSPDNEELVAEFDKYIEALNAGVADATEAIREAERNLARFEAGEDDQAYAVEDAEVALAQAQEEYDYQLEQFNFYNDLLKELMAAIINDEALPENPGEGGEETPAA